MSSSAWKSSFWACIDMYSPAAIDTQPAINATRPASITTLESGRAAAMPSTTETLVIRPSLTPSTAARAVPRWIARWCDSGTLSCAAGCRPRRGGVRGAVAMVRTYRAHARHDRHVPGRYDVTRPQLEALLAGEPAFRAAQVWEGLHRGRAPEEMTELPRRLRSLVAAALPPGLAPGRESRSD